VKKKELEISFMVYGFLIFLCKESQMMLNGLCFVLANVLDYQMFMEKNSKNSTQNMNKKVKEEKQFKQESYGKKLYNHKLKQEHLIWYTKTQLIKNPINNILEP